MYIGLPSESDEANDVPETEDADRSTDLDPDSRSLGSKSSDRSKLTIEPVYAGLFEAIASSMASWFDLSVTELELNDNLLKTWDVESFTSWLRRVIGVLSTWPQ